MTITTQLLLAFIATLTANTSTVGDLCDIVHEKTGVPLRCEPHPDGAPRYEGTVCCDKKACYEAPNGYCLDNEQLFFCELGRARSSGKVDCFFEVPEYCDMFPCKPSYGSLPQANYMCCHEGVCWNYFHGDDCELWDIYWCDDGVTNQNGTVTCFD